MARWTKRFLVFAGTLDNPQGGWSDFCDTCDTIDEAKAALLDGARTIRDNPALKPESGLWYKIVDTEEGEEFGAEGEILADGTLSELF
jgi:hypothetical protein